MRNQKVSRFYVTEWSYPYMLYQGCRFDLTGFAYTARTLGGPTNSYKWTFSTWCKLGNLVDTTYYTILGAYKDANDFGYLRKTSSQKIGFNGQYGGVLFGIDTEALIRDISAWYNIIVSVDTTQAVETNRIKLYINGVYDVDMVGAIWPAQNINLVVNTAVDHRISARPVVPEQWWEGYLAETVFVDGQALTPSDFGESKKGVWVPKKYEGTFGNNGFRLDYSNASHFGEDQSGNDNDFTDSGLTTADQVLDNPTNNYCTLNPLDLDSTGSIYDGNLVVTGGNAKVTMRPVTGKWYYEKDGVGVEYDCSVSGQFDPTLTAGAYNFGQLSWDDGGPSYGYKSICSQNLPKPEILEGNKGFDIVLYEGTGAELAISSLEFSPDLVWIKNRDESDDHRLYDTIRTAYIYLMPNLTDREAVAMEGLKSFDSNGFTLGTDQIHNTNGENYVSWNWKKDPKYGFDIINYQGNGTNRQIAHNLGIVPELMIVKNHENVENWPIYHKDMSGAPETDYLLLDADTAIADNITMWNDTAPTASVFTVGTNPQTNGTTDGMIAYLFASIEGFSKVFGYTGNGNVNGPFIYCGFRPKYLLIKTTAVTDHLVVLDTLRNPHNVVDRYLYTDENYYEDQLGRTVELDILANGFKVRAVDTQINRSGGTIVGIAFAEHPYKYANAR